MVETVDARISNYDFALEFEVRDYECDLIGIVNNAVYQHYLEHTRHEFLKSKGLNFAELFQLGYSLVVTRAELDYKASLKSGDRFVVKLRFGYEGKIRFAFYQDIFKLSDGQLMLKAKIIGTCIHNTTRKLGFPAVIRGALV